MNTTAPLLLLAIVVAALLVAGAVHVIERMTRA